MALLRAICYWVEPADDLQVIQADPDDDRYLACAVAAGTRILVSGDKHLLGLVRYQDIEILTPREFLLAGRATGQLYRVERPRAGAFPPG